jgi:hypothetical protein
VCSSSRVPITPMGKVLTCLPRLTLAQLRTLRSTTVCTCHRDLENFTSPRWETHVLLIVCTGRRCLCPVWHSHDNVFLDHRQHSLLCACSCSKVPNGIFICFALVLAGRRCLRPEWHGHHLIVHHQWQHS